MTPLKMLVLFVFGPLLCAIGSCSGEPTSGKPVDLIGSDKTQVTTALGEPVNVSTYDNVVLDPERYSEAEIEQWLRSTPAYQYGYEDYTVVFNAHDDVIKVTDRSD